MRVWRGEAHELIRSASLPGSLKWLRSGSASEIGRRREGFGHRHLGNTPAVFDRHYALPDTVNTDRRLSVQDTCRTWGENSQPVAGRNCPTIAETGRNPGRSQFFRRFPAGIATELPFTGPHDRDGRLLFLGENRMPPGPSRRSTIDKLGKLRAFGSFLAAPRPAVQWELPGMWSNFSAVQGLVTVEGLSAHRRLPSSCQAGAAAGSAIAVGRYLGSAPDRTQT